MRQFLVTLLLTALAINLVCGEKSEESPSSDNQTSESEENTNSVKTKRGIYNYAIPYGHNYLSYTPYAKFPGIYKGFHGPSYAITPGNAITHSYNVNYPKIYKPASIPLPPPLLLHSRPVAATVPSFSIYAKRFPAFVQKSVPVHRPIFPAPVVPQFATAPVVPHFASTPVVPQFAAAPIVPALPSHVRPLNPIPVASVIPQPSLISQDGWKPIFSTVPTAQTPSFISQPAGTVLPPFANSPTHLTPNVAHAPNNYYLPPDASLHGIGPQTPTFSHGLSAQANGKFTQFMLSTYFVQTYYVQFHRSPLSPSTT